MSAASFVISPDEAAELLFSNPRTLARWRAEGKGPKYIKIGRKVAYRVSDIEEWLTKQTRTPGRTR